MKPSVLAAALSFFLLLPGCGVATVADSTDVEITLIVWPGMDLSPGYTVTLGGDGAVTLVGEAEAPQGTTHLRVAPEKVRRLIELADEIGFDQFDQYEGERRLDTGTCMLSITRGERASSVQCCPGTCPPDLARLILAVEDTAGVWSWLAGK